MSQAAISYAIQNQTPTKQKMAGSKMRILSPMYLNFDFVTCTIGDLENSKIFLSKGAAKFMNDMNISPAILIPQPKNRSVKMLFVTNPDGSMPCGVAFVKDYNVTKIQLFKLASDLNGYELWLVLCPAKVRASKKKKVQEVTQATNNPSTTAVVENKVR